MLDVLFGIMNGIDLSGEEGLYYSAAAVMKVVRDRADMALCHQCKQHDDNGSGGYENLRIVIREM